MNGAQLIAEERNRQINQEGWTPAHDAQWKGQELGFAARCYLDRGVNLIPHLHDPSPFWPFDNEWWRPSEDPVRNLIKAGALIAAEIDRLRAGKSYSGQGAPSDALLGSLLYGLIELGDREDSKGNFRVTLDYENTSDVARVLDGDGNILGECGDLFDDEDDPQETVRRQFLQAIGNALSNSGPAEHRACMCFACGTADHNGGDGDCACDMVPWFDAGRCLPCEHRTTCDVALHPENYPRDPK